MIALGGGVTLALALAAPAAAQVPCVRLDRAFTCADGSSLTIYDDPWSRGRGGAPASGEMTLERGGDWWKDEFAIHGPRGETYLLHGIHVHCGGGITDAQ
jgi:hypothetical protein